MLTEPVTCSSCVAVSVNGGVLHCHGCYMRFIDAVEKLAFEMRPPNAYTPRFVQMCIEARNAALHRASSSKGSASP